ncbi:hypothetical protein C0991_006761 [Blastosporella zonata]|nr:hypothetical protein C0991_006761 [Blastosporella zonata]
MHTWEDDHEDTNSWWSSFLSRAEEQAEAAGESSSSAPNDNEDWLDKNKPLYRVAVKKGYEETAVVILTWKLLKAGTSWMPSVKSIFGCVSCPRWVFDKSSNHLDVNLLCQDVRDIYGHQVFPVPSDSVADYLRELPLFVPEIGTFVRLNAPPSTAVI